MGSSSTDGPGREACPATTLKVDDDILPESVEATLTLPNPGAADARDQATEADSRAIVASVAAQKIDAHAVPRGLEQSLR